MARDETLIAGFNCICGREIEMWLGYSPSFLAYTLLFAHRGQTLFQHVLYPSDSALDAAHRILRELYYGLDDFKALADAGLDCAEYWKTPWEVLKDVSRYAAKS